MSPPRDAREVARRVLWRVDREQGFATAALDSELRGAGLDERDRRLAAELVHGVSRHRSRLDRALAAHAPRGIDRLPARALLALRVAAYQLLFLDRVPAHAAVDDAVGAVRRAGGPGGGKLSGFANAMLRALARDGEPPLPGPEGSRAHVEAAFSLPGWIADAMVSELPDGEAELAAAAAAFHQPAQLVARARRGRIEPAALAARLQSEKPDSTATPSPLAPEALLLDGLGDPDASPSFAAGLWTVQDLGAQLVSLLAGARPGQLLLDACAGVGGKSTHLAELTDDAATIHAADIGSDKLRRLAAAAARLGLGSIRPSSIDLLDPMIWAPPGPLAPDYDAILLDAPCSGLGVLRRHPEAKWRLRIEDVDRLATLQAQLLDAVAPHVRPGGVLVYSVCTFTRAEGPAQVEAFLARHPFELAPPPADAGVPWEQLLDGRGCIRTWPHRHGADGFFAARLIRR